MEKITLANPTLIGGKQILFTLTFDPVKSELECEWMKPVLERLIKKGYLFSLIRMLNLVLGELIDQENQFRQTIEKRTLESNKINA